MSIEKKFHKLIQSHGREERDAILADIYARMPELAPKSKPAKKFAKRNMWFAIGNETKQVVDLRGENVNIEYFGNDSIKLDNSPIMTDYNANGCCFVAPTQPYEFDVTAKVKIEDPIYNIVANFELHFVRNRIAAENISVSAWSANGKNVVSKDKPCRIDVTVTPDDTSFKECEYRILTISRDGYDLDEELIKEIAYFNNQYLEITDKAESGDLIYLQVINKRDPQVKSDIIEICVY